MMRISLIWLLIPLLSFGSLPLSGSGSDTIVTTSEIPPVNLLFGGVSFFRNSEFYNPFTRGETLPGSHLRGALVFSPEDRVTIRGGLFVMLWSGRNRNVWIRPVISVSFDLSERFRLNLGTLDGPDRHGLFDPHFKREFLYTDFVEEGIQLIYNTKSLFSDTWIDWERIIFTGDSFREEFTFGHSMIYTYNPVSGRYSIEVPFQLLAKHWGGQISSYDERVKTHYNIAAGTKMIYSGKKGEAFTEAILFYFNSSKPTTAIPVENGSGLWLRAGGSTGNFSGSAGVWFSENFYSPHGNMMYSSLSDYEPDLIVPQRRVLTGSVSWLRVTTKRSTELYLGLELYYDMRERSFDHALNIHIRLPERLYRLNRTQ